MGPYKRAASGPGAPSPANNDQPLVFLDVETTGLSAYRGDRIIEIAMARCRGRSVLETYQSLVNPERRIHPDASAVNGIYDEDVRDAPRFAEIADDVLAFLGDATMVCHNARFDLSFLTSEMERAGREFAAPRVMDTLAIARQHFRFSGNSLQNIARVLRIPTPNAHRALGDVLTTHAVYCHLMEGLESKGTSVPGSSPHRRDDAASAPEGIEVPQALREAMVSGRRLLIEYRDNSGYCTQRWVTPKEVYEDGHVYLVAYCHLRNDERNFRLDRIVSIKGEQA